MLDSWDGIIMFVSNTIDLNFDSTINRLLVKESRRNNSGNSSSDVMTARGRSANRD